jgi:hypothetical protein
LINTAFDKPGLRLLVERADVPLAVGDGFDDTTGRRKKNAKLHDRNEHRACLQTREPGSRGGYARRILVGCKDTFAGKRVANGRLPPHRNETPLALQHINAASADQLEDARWKLVQKSWDESLPPTELLQLRLIEARLDAEDRLQGASFSAEEVQLQQRQEAILSSLERLIADLRK